MGENSKIGWTHHTFNAWIGCHKISPACQHCYAEAFAKRTGKKVWGLKAPRYFVGENTWNKPLKWNREAEQAGERRRVFCGSMMDILEEHPDEAIALKMGDARVRLWELIDSTPWLDWLLLTKRPENAERVFPWNWQAHNDGLPRNIWMGTTVENQEYADLRIPHLLKIPARVRFLSCEPLLGPVDVSAWTSTMKEFQWATHRALDMISVAERDAALVKFRRDRRGAPDAAKLDWVIAGGESGHGHREHQLEWSRSLRDQCAAAGTPFFFKQTGEHATERRYVSFDRLPLETMEGPDFVPRRRLALAPRSKGESLDEIPPDLRIREFPRSA